MREEPIEKRAVEIRLNPLNWPSDLDASELYASTYNRAAGTAQAMYSEFEQLQADSRANPALTEIGRRQAAASWAEKNLPAMEKELNKVREEVARTTANVTASLTKSFTEPATEPQDIALLQEIRSWLRTMPENERTLKVFDLARKGDRTALRAVLTAPAYLTGVNIEQLGEIRDIVAKADDPVKFGKLQAIKKGAEYADRALDGVMRYVRQEGTVLGKRPGAKAA